MAELSGFFKKILPEYRKRRRSRHLNKAKCGDFFENPQGLNLTAPLCEGLCEPTYICGLFFVWILKTNRINLNCFLREGYVGIYKRFQF